MPPDGRISDYADKLLPQGTGNVRNLRKWNKMYDAWDYLQLQD